MFGQTLQSHFIIKLLDLFRALREIKSSRNKIVELTKAVSKSTPKNLMRLTPGLVKMNIFFFTDYTILMSSVILLSGHSPNPHNYITLY